MAPVSAPWLTIGTKVREILETTFDGIAATSVVVTNQAGTSQSFKCAIVNQLVRSRRETLSVDEAGILDNNVIEVVIKTADITASGFSITPSCFFTLNGERYDYYTSEPFLEKELSPMVGALNIFSRFRVSRAAALENAVPQATGTAFAFGDWPTS